MFKRVTFEEWQSIITVVAFLLTLAGFVYFTFRALTLPKSKRDHLSNLPLDDEQDSPPSPDE